MVRGWIPAFARMTVRGMVISGWIPALARMTVRGMVVRGWIPAFARMTQENRHYCAEPALDPIGGRNQAPGFKKRRRP